MRVQRLTCEEYEKALRALTSSPPIEQLPIWQKFDAQIEGRSFWGYVGLLQDDMTLLAVAAFTQMDTHGYHYLRARHALVWKDEPDEQQEYEALRALARFLHKEDRTQVFVRLAVLHDTSLCVPCLSTLPYDTTVIIDVTGGEDEILSRMKPRGRRDVRKALRECPAELSDETHLAAQSFEPYYQIMLETAQRDGFVAAPLDDYQRMIAALGAEHCRVIAARIDGKLEAWSLITLSGTQAVRYYAATTINAGRKRVADKMILFECLQVASHGCTTYDLMGIGSDFAPETRNLNEFKTKFAKEGVRHVAPDRDLPLRWGFYRGLCTLKALRTCRSARRKKEHS